MLIFAEGKNKLVSWYGARNVNILTPNAAMRLVRKGRCESPKFSHVIAKS